MSRDSFSDAYHAGTLCVEGIPSTTQIHWQFMHRQQKKNKARNEIKAYHELSMLVSSAA